MQKPRLFNDIISNNEFQDKVRSKLQGLQLAA
jgi:hypothetical protein